MDSSICQIRNFCNFYKWIQISKKGIKLKIIQEQKLIKRYLIETENFQFLNSILFSKIILHLTNNNNYVHAGDFIKTYLGLSILNRLVKKFKFTLPAGFEPAAHCLEGSCSIQLS